METKYQNTKKRTVAKAQCLTPIAMSNMSKKKIYGGNYPFSRLINQNHEDKQTKMSNNLLNHQRNQNIPSRMMIGLVVRAIQAIAHCTYYSYKMEPTG